MTPYLSDEPPDETSEDILPEDPPEPEVCSACNGVGSWEFWGNMEKCSLCNGKGIIPAENKDGYDNRK